MQEFIPEKKPLPVERYSVSYFRDYIDSKGNEKTDELGVIEFLHFDNCSLMAKCFLMANEKQMLANRLSVERID